MNDLAATAQDFERGILASKVAGILARPKGRGINRADLTDLDAARRLVLEMLSGAETIQSKQSAAHVTAQSIKSLGVALSPLAMVHRLRESAPMSEHAVLEMLEAMSMALADLHRRRSIPASTKGMEIARAFFTLLADSILSSLNRRRGPQRSAAHF